MQQEEYGIGAWLAWGFENAANQQWKPVLLNSAFKGLGSPRTV